MSTTKHTPTPCTLPTGALKDCRFYFRLKMVEALCNFRFDPSGDGFKITEPETGCVWFGSKNDGGQWIFTLERGLYD